MAVDTYTTTQGETWDIVSKALWGDEKLMHLLLAVNPDHQEAVIFSGGVVLEVPDVTDEDLVQANLPPWKRGVRLT